MVFSSLIFLNYFLPGVLIAYFLAPSRLKNTVLLLASYLFYAWGAPKILPLLFISSLVDYFASKQFARVSSESESGPSAAKNSWQKYCFYFALLTNVFSLLYFKYANFFIGELSNLLEASGSGAIAWSAVALPIGISFFTFQKISYLVDVWQDRAQPPKSFLQYALFVACFPQLIAGPIVRFHDISKQLDSREHNLDNIFQGGYRFIIGLAKKVLIANPLALVNYNIDGLDINTLPCDYAWFGIICYSMQIYFDFSGYSDMAIGLGQIFGFKFPENFNHPYISKNITEFWRRWHMTLSEWMKLYLYIPLGGNRVSALRVYCNLWIVFLLSGLWHGAAWNFLAWGAFHGFFLIMDKLFWLRISKRLPSLINITLTFVVVLFGWVLFRANSLDQAIAYMSRLLAFNSFAEVHTWYLWGDMLTNRTTCMFVLALFMSFYPAFIRSKREATLSLKPTELSLSRVWSMGGASAVLLILCTFSLVSSHFNPFIYFRF